MSDGNNMTDGQPTKQVSTNGNILQPLAPGAFGVMQTTHPIVAGTPSEPTIQVLTGPEGAIAVECHPLRVMPVAVPGQDNPGIQDPRV